MAYTLPPEIHQRVREKTATGRYASEEEVLHDALNALTEEEEDLAAIRQAVAEYQAGDPGVPLDQAFAAVRTLHHRTEPETCLDEPSGSAKDQLSFLLK